MRRSLLAAIGAACVALCGLGASSAAAADDSYVVVLRSSDAQSVEHATGVAPGTRIVSVKVLNSKATGTLSQILCGIDWVTANAAAWNIRVANMSITGSGRNDGNCGNTNNDAEHQAICRSVAAGVTYTVSAGNSKTDFAGSIPAAYPPCANQSRTRIARSVFHRLGLPSPSSMAKCMRPGWGFSSGQRPSASRFDTTRSIAAAIRSSGAAPAARR